MRQMFDGNSATGKVITYTLYASDMPPLLKVIVARTSRRGVYVLGNDLFLSFYKSFNTLFLANTDSHTKYRKIIC